MLYKQTYKVSMRDYRDMILIVVGIVAFITLEMNNISGYRKGELTRGIILLMQLVAAANLYIVGQCIHRFFFKKRITVYGIEHKSKQEIINLPIDYLPVAVDEKGTLLVHRDNLSLAFAIIETGKISYSNFINEAEVIKAETICH